MEILANSPANDLIYPASTHDMKSRSKVTLLHSVSLYNIN